jgi:hypothetical protein
MRCRRAVTLRRGPQATGTGGAGPRIRKALQEETGAARSSQELHMTKAMFVMSTGRCATQFLAHALEDRAGDVVVEHEPIGARYRPRLGYRKPNKLYETLGRNLHIQRKFFEVEEHLSAGRRYVDVGWPTFAWLDYLESRFGDRFEFIHLVRNPFHVAASTLTHGAFAGREDMRTRTCFIRGTDRKVIHGEFAETYDDFTPFEKALYSWLEINAHVQGAHDKPGFRGLFRFEELFSGDKGALDGIAATIMGRPVTGLTSEPYDKYSRRLKAGIELRNEALHRTVVDRAVSLGYDRDDLESSLDVPELEALYMARRVATAT